MDKQAHLDRLIAAQPVADLVLQHSYLPQGNSHIVSNLNEIHKEVYGKGVMLYCSSCVIDMFKRLYFHYKHQLIDELTPKEPIKETKTKKNGIRQK